MPPVKEKKEDTRTLEQRFEGLMMAILEKGRTGLTARRVQTTLNIDPSQAQLLLESYETKGKLEYDPKQRIYWPI